MIYICKTCSKSFEHNRKRDNCFDCMPVKNRYANEEDRITAIKKKNIRSVVSRRMKIKNMAINYKGGKCSICGYNKYTGALEFHHINPNVKDFQISNHYTRAWETIRVELDKCICVCSNCHKEIHAGIITL